MRPVALLALTLVACNAVDIVIADVPDGGFLPHGPPCTSTTDCAPGLFCEKPACGAPAGHCERRPAVCDDDIAVPVCGCNGVTYFNDCLRREGGVEASVQNECAGGTACARASDCPDHDAVCAWLAAPNACGGVVGACWVAPESCPKVHSGWVPCAGGACTDLCAAIHAQAPTARTAPPCR